MAVDYRNAFLLEVSRNHEDARLIPDPRELDRPTLDRLCVNLLRHEHTGYDDALAGTFGQTGRNPAIRVIRFRIHREIARRWPGLREECGLKITDTGLALE